MTSVDNSERYNQIFHAIGKKVKAIRAKDVEDLSDIEKRFIEDYDTPDDEQTSSSLRKQIDNAVGELYHFFVGPVQRDTGGFPDHMHSPDGDGSLMTELNIKIQAARLLVISSIPPQDCLSDPLGSMRQAFPYYDDRFVEEVPITALQQIATVEEARKPAQEILSGLSEAIHEIEPKSPGSTTESRKP